MFNETAYDLAIGAGCSPSGASIAAAIAQAESSGIPTRYNPETAAKGGTPQGQGSYGLWQIYLKAHPEFAGQNLYDPQANAAAMYAVSNGCTNFTPWTTFTHNLYQKFLQTVGGDIDTGSTGSTPLPGTDTAFPDASADDSGGSTLTTWLPLVAIAGAAYFLLR